MEKTVIVIAANSLSQACSGHTMTFELSPGKAKMPSTRTASKTLWTTYVEAMTEYCRVVFDLFPDKYQVCVAAVDEQKCQPVNSWRDEDQELSKVLNGLQKFGAPQSFSSGAPGHSHLNSGLQGLHYGVKCLAQLTATQYAMSSAGSLKPPVNQGRILFFSTLKSTADIKELERAVMNTIKSENADIKLKMDSARLPIQHCQLVIINTHTPPLLTSDIKDAPLTQHSVQFSSVVYSFPAKILLEKCVSLAKLHFNLKTTVITGIPMKEEQAGGSSANYDVELIHLAEAHRDILRAVPKREGKEGSTIYLKWSTPKSTSLDLHFCTSAYRVTPTNAMSRPTVCLVNFLLSGKPVLLEQPKKGGVRLVSHVLYSHGGGIHLQSIPSSRSYLDDPPSISEGWGGRVTDYRITDFNQLIQDNMLYPNPIDRTQIPTVYPLQKALTKLERQTRHWPLTYNDTLIYTLAQDLDALPFAVPKESMSDAELDCCKKVITSLQEKESSNEPLSIPNSGGRNKGVKREEQYRALWNEIEMLAELHSANSENHRILHEFILQVLSHSSSSAQPSRKTPVVKTENGGPPVSISTPAIPPMTVSSHELAWADLDRYQLMTEREKKDTNMGDTNNDHGVWRVAGPPSITSQQKPMPVPAKPVASLLSIWTTRQRSKGGSHPEFAGRLVHGSKAELYPSLGSNTSVVPPSEQED